MKKYIQYSLIVMVCMMTGVYGAEAYKVPRNSLNIAPVLYKKKIDLLYRNGNFYLRLDQKELPIRKCFISSDMQNFDQDLLEKYIQAGGVLKVSCVAENEYAIEEGGGLKGGIELFTIVFAGKAFVVQATLPTALTQFSVENIMRGMGMDSTVGPLNEAGLILRSGLSSLTVGVSNTLTEVVEETTRTPDVIDVPDALEPGDTSIDQDHSSRTDADGNVIH